MGQDHQYGGDSAFTGDGADHRIHEPGACKCVGGPVHAGQGLSGAGDPKHITTIRPFRK